MPVTENIKSKVSDENDLMIEGKKDDLDGNLNFIQSKVDADAETVSKCNRVIEAGEKSLVNDLQPAQSLKTDADVQIHEKVGEPELVSPIEEESEVTFKPHVNVKANLAEMSSSVNSNADNMASALNNMGIAVNMGEKIEMETAESNMEIDESDPKPTSDSPSKSETSAEVVSSKNFEASEAQSPKKSDVSETMSPKKYVLSKEMSPKKSDASEVVSSKKSGVSEVVSPKKSDEFEAISPKKSDAPEAVSPSKSEALEAASSKKSDAFEAVSSKISVDTNLESPSKNLESSSNGVPSVSKSPQIAVEVTEFKSSSNAVTGPKSPKNPDVTETSPQKAGD